jgi:hypothetical protein
MKNHAKGNQETDRNRAAIEAQESLAKSHQQAGGSAMLDASIQADEQTNPHTTTDAEHPAGSNQTGASRRTDPTKAEQFDTTGAYPPDFQQLDDEGSLSMKSDEIEPD